MATELGGSQITTLMETLPGIANVLRSRVADAIINMIRAAVRLKDFQYSDADELIKFAIPNVLAPLEQVDSSGRPLGDPNVPGLRDLLKKREKAPNRKTTLFEGVKETRIEFAAKQP